MSELLVSPIQKMRETNLKTRASFELDRRKFFEKIDSIPELHGASVVYIDQQSTIAQIRPFDPSCNLKPVKIVLREPPQKMSESEFAAHLSNSNVDVRESKLVGELAGAALSCGAAVLGWVVVLGSGAVIPLTGGGSTVITALAYGATIASTAQCVNGVVRSGAEVANPDLNDYLDSQEWYSNAGAALDVISLAGAGAAGAMTVKTMKLLQASSGKSAVEALKSLSRHERKRITQEIIRLNNPNISGQVMKALIKAGQYPKRFSGMQITQSMRLQLKDALGASLSFSGSALSGTVNSLAVGIYEEL